MTTLKIKKENACRAYNLAGQEGKALLENLFGKDVISQPITDRVSCFEDICREAGENMSDFEITAGMSDREIGFRAAKKVLLIMETCNEGWHPDYSDAHQDKYEIRWKYSAGSGFSYDGYRYGRAHSGVGARLVTFSVERAKWIAETFGDDFQFFLIKN